LHHTLVSAQGQWAVPYDYPPSEHINKYKLYKLFSETARGFGYLDFAVLGYYLDSGIYHGVLFTWAIFPTGVFPK
jgi:hypothetical protein